MLTSNAVRTHIPLAISPSGSHSGLSGVFAAAVVSTSFREMLLQHPERALNEGYMGTHFDLSAEDAALVISINAKSLQDLAQHVLQTLGQ